MHGLGIWFKRARRVVCRPVEKMLARGQRIRSVSQLLSHPGAAKLTWEDSVRRTVGFSCSRASYHHQASMTDRDMQTDAIVRAGVYHRVV